VAASLVAGHCLSFAQTSADPSDAGQVVAPAAAPSRVHSEEDPGAAQDGAAEGATAGDQATVGKSPIVVEADSLEAEKDSKRVKAKGNVVVEWNATRLKTGSLSIDQRERVVEGSGGITYESDEVLGTADSIRIDVDDETGVFENVDLQLKNEPGRFGGTRLEKLPGRHLLLDDGYFTTCDVDEDHPPDWELRGKHLDLQLDNYARLSQGRLQIRGVPVLYIPYLVFPTKQTRQSGLLAPSFGSSSRRGFIYDQPLFWNIDKQQDLTLTSVVETSARLGLDANYRYAPTRRRMGSIEASYYNETLRGNAQSEIDSPLFAGSDIPQDRGSIDLTHREIRDHLIGYADILLVSDDLFLREVDAVEGDAVTRELRRSRRYTSSRAGFIADRSFTSGGVEMLGYQDLVGARDFTVQKPLGAWVRSDGGVGPLVFDVESTLDSFERTEGADGQRLDVATTAGIPLLLTDRLVSRAWVRGRATGYAMNAHQLQRDGGIEHFDDFPTRGIIEGGADARTKLGRQYALSSQTWSSVYHTVEPFVGFHYLEQTESDPIPLYDGLDAFDERDVARYGVDSRFLLRWREDPAASRAPFELGRISLSQSYNLFQKVVDDHFSDIDLAAFVQPLEGLALRTLTSWNVGASEVRGAYASISWDQGSMRFLPGPSNQVAAAFRYVRSSDEADILESSELFARLGLTRHITLGLRGRYDFISSTFVEKGGGFTFSAPCDCWSIGIAVVKRVNPDEFQVRVGFELKGLGGFGSGPSARSSPALGDVGYQDLGFWRAGW